MNLFNNLDPFGGIINRNFANVSRRYVLHMSANSLSFALIILMCDQWNLIIHPKRRTRNGDSKRHTNFSKRDTKFFLANENSTEAICMVGRNENVLCIFNVEQR